MPSSNGVYSLPPGYLAATGTTIQVSQHNPIFEDVAAALTLRLSRDGTAPMTGPLNLAAGSPVAPSLIFLGNRACFDRLDAAMGRVVKEIEAIMNEYRDERGADETCTCGLTYINNRPVVDGRTCGLMAH
jgi:hypothetical protein